MGDPDYDKAKADRDARRKEQDAINKACEDRDAKAEALFDLFATSITDFLEGKACLVVEPTGDNRTVIRFKK